MHESYELLAALHVAPFQLEVVAAELISNGVALEDITVIPLSNFKRSYRGEIDHLSLSIDEITARRKVAISVHRDGLYDRLPEGVFHQPDGHGRVSSANDMRDEHRRYKEEEAAARKFFVPFESGFMQLSVLVAQFEKAQYIDMLSGKLGENWLRFWGIPDGIPAAMSSRLLSLVPWIWQIAGSSRLAGLALSLILDKQVRVMERWQNFHGSLPGGALLGNAVLGGNAVLSGNFYEPWPVWVFEIGGLSATERAQFVAGKSLARLLDRFEELFTPLQIDIIFDFLPIDTQTHFEEEVLGVGFVL